MRISVLGGGIVGVTTAWELAEDGHEVSLIEQADTLGAGTSRANGGQIAVGESGPWSTPDLAYKLWRQIGEPYPPFRLRVRADHRQWTWLLSFLTNCMPHAYARALKRNFLLAQYSARRLENTRQKLGDALTYDAQRRGILQLFSCAKTWGDAKQHAAHLQDTLGGEWQMLDAAGCIAHEPALQHAFAQGLFVGGLLSPQDESGDAYLFANRLGDALKKRVQFVMGAKVRGLARERGKVVAVQTESGDDIRTDACVVAMGCASAKFLRHYGVSLPIVPLKGYSLTLPDVSAAREHAPLSSLTDYGQRLVLSRLGDRLRVAGYAELGFNANKEDKRVRGLAERLARLFPHAGDYRRVQSWCGFRPMSADGAPFIGQALRRGARRLLCARPPSNLYVNAGHGSLGWTLSHGSARLLADIISGNASDEATPFATNRRTAFG